VLIFLNDGWELKNVQRVNGSKSEAESVFFQDEGADVYELKAGNASVVKATSTAFAPRLGTPLASAVCRNVMFLFYQGTDRVCFNLLAPTGFI
jgi:hypothetical protein